MSNVDRVGVSGLARVTIATPDPDAVTIQGMDWDRCGWAYDRDSDLWHSAEATRSNAYVNLGLQRFIDKMFNATGTAPVCISISSDNTAVTAASTTFGATYSSSSGFTANSRTGNVQTSQADFTKGTPGAGTNLCNFSIRKIGISSTTADGAMMDCIGGAGSSPYNEPLTIDLSSATSFTLTIAIDTTLVAV